jgi:hypothetical protein
MHSNFVHIVGKIALARGTKREYRTKQELRTLSEHNRRSGLVRGCGKMLNTLHNLLSFAAVTGFVVLMCHVVSLAA